MKIRVYDVNIRSLDITVIFVMYAVCLMRKNMNVVLRTHVFFIYYSTYLLDSYRRPRAGSVELSKVIQHESDYDAHAVLRRFHVRRGTETDRHPINRSNKEHWRLNWTCDQASVPLFSSDIFPFNENLPGHTSSLFWRFYTNFETTNAPRLRLWTSIVFITVCVRLKC